MDVIKTAQDLVRRVEVLENEVETLKGKFKKAQQKKRKKKSSSSKTK